MNLDATSRKRRMSVGHTMVTIPQELTEEQLDEIRRCFDALDINKDGRISTSEIIKSCQLLGMNPTPTEAKSIIAAADLNKDGFINFQEYITVMKEKYVSIDIEQERMKAAFNVLDTDKDGFVSRSELRHALAMNENMTEDERNEIDKYFDVWDINGDGKLDYTEFVESTLCTTVFQ